MIRPNKVKFAIGTYLLSGFLPWGVDFRSRRETPSLSLCGPTDGRRPPAWILCCGHTLTPKEAEAWKAAGLAADGPPDRFGRSTLVAGPNLERWLSAAWHGLRAKTWAAQ